MLVSLMQFVTDLTPPPQLVAVWAEERGFAGLYVPEKTHVPISRSTPWPGGELPDWYRRCYDPVVALAAAAAVTTRLRVGTGACLVAVHDPILLAKQIASLCAMSGERFVLGVGFGWNVEELADHGVPFADRIAVTVDKLAAMRALWAAEPVHYEGTHASVPPSWAWPKPAVAPPVLFGCRPSARAFEVIARHGDGWQPIEGYGELLGALPMLHAAFERAGRDRRPPRSVCTRRPATRRPCTSTAGPVSRRWRSRCPRRAATRCWPPWTGRPRWWMRSPETTGRSKAMPSADVGRQTRAQILRAAMDIASVKGLSGLSIGELAGRLGMSKSGLFRHFGAKEQLQLATVEAAVSVFEAEVVAPAMAAPPGVDRVRALMHAWVGYLERDVPAAAFSRPRPPTWTHSLARCATASPRPGGPESPPSRPTSKRRNAGARSGRISKCANSRSSCTPTRWRPTGRCCCSTTTAPESGRERRSTRPWPESAPPRRESNHEICQPY